MGYIRRKIDFFRSLLSLGSKYKGYSLIERLRIIIEYSALYFKKGITIDEYYDFEFERQPIDFKNSFLGRNEQRYYLDFLNPIKYYILSRNKYLAHRILDNTGVRKSELYCYYQPEGKVIDSNEIANNIDQVCDILKSKSVSSCVIKTTESSHGDNVWVFKQIQFLDGDALMIRFDDESMKLSEILSDEPLIIESLIKQTKQFSDLNPSSVNTVRFMTVLLPDGTAKVIATFIKIGRAGKCVDNAGDGGNVDVCVDVDTGEIKYAIQYDGWRKITEISSHPDSGKQLNGVVVDDWENIKAEVIRFQQALPHCKVAGWDIAITDDGPVVIEVNDFWDRTGQYFIRKGWRNEIRDCFMAWKKTGKEYKLGRLPNKLGYRQLNKIVNYR